MSGIFISYRRQDSQSAAGRLADHLKDHMRGVTIFRDVETIEPGVDFVDAINRALRACGVLLAVIGPRWLHLEAADGTRRLDDPNDYTRLEIATALRRDDVRVIPVLVDGAEMPATGALPDDLKALSRRNAIELTDKRWEYDVSQLVETLNKALGVTPIARPESNAEPQKEAPPPATGWARWPKWQWAVGIAGLVLLALVIDSENGLDTPPMPMPDNVMPLDPVSQPQPFVPPVAPPPTASSTTVSLAGAWLDAEGGTYQIEQQGNQIAFQGVSPHGPVMGRGLMQGSQLVLEYLLGNAPYQARLRIGADGASLEGQYVDLINEDSGPISLRRAR